MCFCFDVAQGEEDVEKGGKNKTVQRGKLVFFSIFYVKI